MRIIHAVCDENGQGRGGTRGDQTGREIRTADWYDKPWSQYIEPLDTALAKSAVTIAKAICDGDYGYNKDDRWSGYDAICASSIEDGCGDFDCSSLVLSCYRLSGLNIKEKTGYTGNLAKLLTATGKFRLVTSGEVLTNPKLAKLGALYCVPSSHVCICIEDGDSADPKATERVRALGSVRIRETPKTGKTIAIAHKGDVIEVFGQDAESGWYKAVTGYITNNPRYVEKL